MKPIGSVKKIFLKEIMTFKDAGQFEADFIPFSFFQEMAKKHKLKDWFIDEDCDGYIRKNGKDHLVFIFRKQLLPEDLEVSFFAVIFFVTLHHSLSKITTRFLLFFLYIKKRKDNSENQKYCCGPDI